MVDCADHFSSGVLDQFRTVFHQYSSAVVKRLNQLILIMVTKSDNVKCEENFLAHLASVQAECSRSFMEPTSWKDAKKHMVVSSQKREREDTNAGVNTAWGGEQMEAKIQAMKTRNALPADYELPNPRSHQKTAGTSRLWRW